MQQKSFIHNVGTYYDQIRDDNLSSTCLIESKKRRAILHQKGALAHFRKISAYQLLTLRGVKQNPGAD